MQKKKKGFQENEAKTTTSRVSPTPINMHDNRKKPKEGKDLLGVLCDWEKGVGEKNPSKEKF